MVDGVHLNVSKNGNKIVIAPSLWKAVPFLVLSFAFILCGILTLGGITDPQPLFSNLHLSWAAAAQFLTASLLFAAAILCATPRISVNSQAINYTTPFSKRSYDWEYVGPFFADSRHNHFYSRQYICAFTKEKHDLMAAGKQHLIPTVKIADILISLRSLPQGKDIKTAQGFAVMVNSCRDEFEAPESKGPKHAVRRTAWSR